MNVPEKPSIEGLEAKWDEWWEAAGTYRFDRSRPREDVFAIDTPPPTASGSLHIGHVLSYTHTDVIARFQAHARARPSSTRSAGTTTGCPPSDGCRTTSASGATRRFPTTRTSTLDALERPDGDLVAVSRPNFIELCERLTAEDEKAFEALFRLLGPVGRLELHVHDDRRAFAQGVTALVRPAARSAGSRTSPRRPRCGTSTTRPRSRRPRSRIGRSTVPTTGSAFDLADGQGSVEIETSRPELLPACVALVVNPEDERYAALVGKNAVTPLFGAESRSSRTSSPNPTRGPGSR